MIRILYIVLAVPFLLLQNHYPDVLDYAKAAPLSWFFSMCYRVGSTVMDAKSRARIQLVKDSEVSHMVKLMKILECCNWSDIY